MEHFVGVDVGTGSVRAVLTDARGSPLAKAIRDIRVYNPRSDFYLQSSSEIWESVLSCIKSVTKDVEGARVSGLGFDATCSLVAIDKDGVGISLEEDEGETWDVIMWMDHRAKLQTDAINETRHRALDFVGGKMSLEMQTPKLLWLKRNCPKAWKSTAHFFDLPDFLTWKATAEFSSSNSPPRSLCSTVCKWTHDGDRWDDTYFRKIGLDDLVDEGYSRIGTRILGSGVPYGTVNSKVSRVIGSESALVATSLIDAHAGALQMLACKPAKDIAPLAVHRLGLICGTSTCHMALAESPVNVPGVWGPYKSALLPGLWLLEGGQTSVGSLVDHILDTHPAFENAKKEAESRGLPLQQHLEAIAGNDCVTAELHLYPDFHGNRSPLANANMKGAICGLTLNSDVNNLAALYVAAIQATAYGTKHIVDVMEDSNVKIRVATLCGGFAKSDFFVQTYADVLGLPVVRPDNADVCVPLGAALLSVAASRFNGNLNAAVDSAEVGGQVFKPRQDMLAFHRRKYRVFRAMAQDQIKYGEIMRHEEGEN